MQLVCKSGCDYCTFRPLCESYLTLCYSCFQNFTELEEFVGCNFEKDNQDLCDKEMQDRIDVAEILRLQVELKLR